MDLLVLGARHFVNHYCQEDAHFNILKQTTCLLQNGFETLERGWKVLPLR